MIWKASTGYLESQQSKGSAWPVSDILLQPGDKPVTFSNFSEARVFNLFPWTKLRVVLTLFVDWNPNALFLPFLVKKALTYLFTLFNSALT